MRHFTNIWQAIPVDKQAWRKELKARQKLIIEIGSGAGLHAIQLAKSRPDAFIIAIERTHTKATKLARRAANHPELTNLYPVHGDAVPWICENLQSHEVSEYYILYPNPYPKAAQANKRFMHMPFMHYLLDTLLPGGSLTVATNEMFYRDEAKVTFVRDWGLMLTEDGILQSDFTARSHFEKKYLARGECCYHMKFNKIMNQSSKLGNPCHA